VTDPRPDARSAALGMPEADSPTSLRRMSIAAAIACALAVATLATYLVLLARQGTPLNNPRVLFVAVSIAIFSALTGIGALIRQARTRTLLLTLATAGLLGVGFIGAWSIGISLLLAGVLTGAAAAAAARASAIRPLHLAAGGILVVSAVWAGLFVGPVVTDSGRP
jgi:hypothetical protein